MPWTTESPTVALSQRLGWLVKALVLLAFAAYVSGAQALVSCCAQQLPCCAVQGLQPTCVACMSAPAATLGSAATAALQPNLTDPLPSTPAAAVAGDPLHAIWRPPD